MDERLRGAIIGFGNVARHAHLPAWRENDHFRLVAVLDPDPKQAQLARDLLPQTPVYSEMGLMLAENALNFVDICTPPCFHADLILKACEAGLHVFCEKPLVTQLESLRRIQRAAQESHRIVFTVNNWKHAPLWIKVREIIRSKKIGTVRSVSLTVLRPSDSGGGLSNWRRCPEVAGGGILLDHGWHHFYLVVSIMGEWPLSVCARMEYAQSAKTHLEEMVDLIMPFPSGEVRLHLTWRASCRRNHGVITGDEGTILVNDDHLMLLPHDLPAIRYDFAEPLSGGSHHPEWMKPVLEDFLLEIFNPSVRGTNWAEAKGCAELTHLAYQSCREGSPFLPARNLAM